MVTVTIWGTPDDGEEKRRNLTQELLRLMRSYKPPEERTTVVFPLDRVQGELDEGIFVEIRGPVSLFVNVRRPLAEVVGETVAKYFPTSVECVVHLEQVSPSTQWRVKRELD